MERNSIFSRFINFINTYSIWVALGSFSSFLFFSKLYDKEPNLIVSMGLSLGVWAIYTLDHLLDGIKLSGKATTLRHQKHFENQSIMIWILALVSIFLAVLFFWIPTIYYELIYLLTFLTGLHFVINYLIPKSLKKKIFLKEVFIAAVVTVGFVLTPYVEVSLKNIEQDCQHLLLIFFFINLSNLMLFSFYDKESDESAGTLSLAGFYSNRTLQTFIYLSTISSGSFVAYAYVMGFVSAISTIVFVAMLVTLGILNIRTDYFKKDDRYRFYGDLIYVYPLFALPFL